jgi:hypothetical protein
LRRRKNSSLLNQGDKARTKAQQDVENGGI